MEEVRWSGVRLELGNGAGRARVILWYDNYLSRLKIVFQFAVVMRTWIFNLVIKFLRRNVPMGQKE